MTIKDKVEEVIAIADPVSDRFLELIKNSKRKIIIIILIVALSLKIYFVPAMKPTTGDNFEPNHNQF